MIRELSKIDGLVWIRLLYCYPELIDGELIDEIASNDKVAKYLDIPLQHSQDAVLKRMGRKSARESLEKLFFELRSKVPDISLRTTFILGFPGETQEDFNGLCDFVKTQRMNNVGFFTYSREDGTAAARMKNQIPEKVKEQRLSNLAALQYDIVREQNAAMQGKKLRVIIDEEISSAENKFLYKARSQYNAPDIDGCVYVSSDKPLEAGQFTEIVVKGFSDYDLKGDAK